MKKVIFWLICMMSLWITSCKKAPPSAPMPSFMSCTIQDADSLGRVLKNTDPIYFKTHSVSASFVFDKNSSDPSELDVDGYYNDIWRIHLEISHVPDDNYKATFILPEPNPDPDDLLGLRNRAIVFYAPHGLFPESDADFQNGTWWLSRSIAQFFAPSVHGSITISELDTVKKHNTIRGFFQGLFFGHGTYKKVSNGRFLMSVKDSIYP